MSARIFLPVIFCFCLLSFPVSAFAQNLSLTDDSRPVAAANYQKYCVLCHGEEREGHVNDYAPSLRSESLIGSGFPLHIYQATAYGRRGTPMAGFLDEVGGPMTRQEMIDVVVWLKEMSGVEPVAIGYGEVVGDAALGQQIYQVECAECHGPDGEGITGTALGNPAMLSLTNDQFIRYAIVNGRQNTPMPGFGDKLQDNEIDALTAFIRSRASGWAVEKPVYRRPPAPQDYVLNPDGEAPVFDLKDDLYVSAEDLDQALQQKRRFILLDTRVTNLWQMANIEGSVPIPYYEDFDAVVDDLPADGTWIVTYCECPRAAAESTTRNLRARGFTNTAVLWEGIQGWVALGYPVTVGDSTPVDVSTTLDAPPVAESRR